MIEMPHGSGRLYALSQEEWNLKKCLVIVQNEDYMCAARAISVCLSYLRDGPSSSKYKNMKHSGRKEQGKAANALHVLANVPITEYGVGLDDLEVSSRSWHKLVASAPHPAFELDQYQLIRAVDQTEIANRAISITTVMKSELVIRSTQATNLRITAYHNIQRGSNPCDTTS